MKKVREIRSAAAAVLAVAAVYLFFHLAGIGCPIRFLSGISCPGCGMTRAAVSLVCLRFADAWYYHPMVFLLPPAAAVFLLKRRIPRKVYRALVSAAVVMFIAVYAIRMFGPANEIVTFHPEQGFIYRMIHYFIH